MKTTFLHGELEKNYAHEPKGFIAEEKEDHVCRFRRSFYSLKRSLMQWLSILTALW
jgi:hypothetical protein